MRLSVLAAYAACAQAATIYLQENVVVREFTTVTVSGTPPGYSATATPTTTTPTTEPTTTEEAETTTSKTSTSTTAASTDSLSSFESEILAEHNKKRALHGSPAMSWNADLAKFAADYAASVVDCDNMQLIHSGGPYGENLAAGYPGGASSVDAWYDEIQYYDYNNPGFSEQTGHFTQVVWKASVELGCAYITCNNAWRQYTICEYSPAGNVGGQYEAQVPPLLS